MSAVSVVNSFLRCSHVYKYSSVAAHSQVLGERTPLLLFPVCTHVYMSQWRNNF